MISSILKERHKSLILHPKSAFTETKANELRLTGWVKNKSDGSVEGEAQGDQSSLDKFVQHLNIGPRQAKVSKVEQKEIDSKEGESSFAS